MKYLSLTLILFLHLVSSSAQSVISEAEFLNQVFLYHPVAQQANLLEEIAFAKLLKAKGAFDPKLEMDYQQKNFDDKNYFQLLQGTVKVPTWIGADVKLAYNWNSGVYLNPENNVPTRGLITAGIDLPILQGLIFDKRRADLQTAKNYKEMGSLEKQQALNQLVFDALEAYWLWYEAYQNNLIAKEGLTLAENTFELVKGTYALGDKAAIDTIESLIQVQNRQVELGTATLNFMNAKLWLSSFLWMENFVPAQITDTAIPENYYVDRASIDSTLQLVKGFEDSLSLRHPKIEWYAFNVQNYEIEKRLKKEMLKPQLNLGYNFLNEVFQDNLFDQFNIANYKWNVNFSMPLFLRKERADLKMVKAKQESANLQYNNLQLQQRNKIEMISNKIGIYLEQLRVNDANILNNRTLVDAEKKKFTIGESSLFLVNYREIALLKVLQKQAEIEAKLKIALAELDLEVAW